MIARATETAITFGALALAALGLGAVILATWRKPRGARALEIGGGAGIVVGGLVAVYLIAMPTDLIIARGGAPMELERYALLSDSTIRLADQDLVIERGDDTVVVNESDRELRIVTFVYGEDETLPLGDTIVRRGGMASFGHRLTNVGPDDEPPESVTVSKRDSAQHRYWLTWDR